MSWTTDLLGSGIKAKSGGMVNEQQIKAAMDAPLAPNNIFKSLSSLFGGSKPNENDYKGWDDLDKSIGAPKGDSPSYWVLHDGDSIQNEAKNIVSYIRASPDNLQNMMLSNWGKTVQSEIFLNKLIDKLNRGGQKDAVNAIKNVGNNTSNLGTSANINTSSGSNPAIIPPPVKKTNYWLIGGIAVGSIAVIGTIIYLVVRKKS